MLRLTGGGGPPLEISDPVARMMARTVARVRRVATEREVSAALGTRWPWYVDTTPRTPPPGDPAGSLCEAAAVVIEWGGSVNLRGRPIREDDFWGI